MEVEWALRMCSDAFFGCGALLFFHVLSLSIPIRYLVHNDPSAVRINQVQHFKFLTARTYVNE